MNSKRNALIGTLFISLAIIVTSCAKEEGVGGLASIRGRIFVKEYNSTFTVLKDSYYAQDESVYIVYGDDVSYADKVNTNYDGWFEFQYLRPGKYKVYCYSKDSTLQTLAKIPIIEEVEITARKQSILLDEMVIFN